MLGEINTIIYTGYVALAGFKMPHFHQSGNKLLDGIDGIVET